MYEAIIKVEDTVGTHCNARIVNIPEDFAPDQSKLTTLVTLLKTYLNGGIRRYDLLHWQETENTSSVTPAGVNSDKVLVLYSWADAAGDTHYGRMFLPNPDLGTGWENISGQGWFMETDTKAALAVALTTAFGGVGDVSVSMGRLVSRAGKRMRHQSCIKFLDGEGSLAYCYFPASNAEALATLATALQALSISKVVSSLWLTRTSTTPNPASGIGLAASDADVPAWSSATERIIATFSYPFTSGDNPTERFQRLVLPTVKSASMDKTPAKKHKGDDWALKGTAGTAIAGGLTTFFGSENRTLTYSGQSKHRTHKSKV
jgi:hypothetical protein